MNKSNKVDPRIVETQLPSVLALENGLQDDPVSNPEIYLREFLNASKYFQSKSLGEKYKAPDSEANGENDAITKAYEIDFKTLISSSMGRGKRNTSWQKIMMMPGVIATTEPRSRDTFTVTYITKIMRSYTIEDLEQETYKKEDEPIASDVTSILKVLQKDKNILLFFPSQFHINALQESEDPISILTSALNHDTSAFLKYREESVLKKDTFLSTIYGDRDEFVIWKYESDSLKYIESIPLNKSKTFMYLAQFASL